MANAFKGKREMGRWIDGGLLEGREEEEEMLRMMGIWMTNRGPLEGQRGMWPVIAVSSRLG